MSRTRTHALGTLWKNAAKISAAKSNTIDACGAGCASAHGENDPTAAYPTTRRGFLLAGLSVLLVGCGGQKAGSSLPGPSWRVSEAPPPQPSRYQPRPVQPSPAPPAVGGSSGGMVISRTSWSPDTALPSRMNHMNGVRFITIHHDGISPFYDHDERSTRQRMESIRRFHRDHLGWGDIGYHYIIDREGRIWEGRSIAYQGAHVGNHNEHNVGVLLLGHFDQQSPSDRQLAAMQDHVSQLMQRYRVPIGRVTTHREWETARTVCPGHTLQAYMDHIRRRGQLG